MTTSGRSSAHIEIAVVPSAAVPTVSAVAARLEQDLLPGGGSLRLVFDEQHTNGLSGRHHGELPSAAWS